MSARRGVATLAPAAVLLLTACAGPPDVDALSERIEARLTDATAEVSLAATASPGLSNLQLVLGIDREPTGDELAAVLEVLLEDSLDAIGRVSVGAYSAPGDCIDVGPAIDELDLTTFAFDRHGVEECTILLINRNDLEEWGTAQ